MQEKIWILFCILCLLHPTALLGVEGRITLRSDELVVTSEKSLAIEAEYIREVFPSLRGQIERTLRWNLRSRPFVTVVGNDSDFQKMGGTGFISAFAVPQRSLIVINLASGVGDSPHLLRETFQHELCHLFLHDNIEEALLPKWLDEGTCQWVSGSLGEIAVGSLEREALARIDLSRHAVPLEDLSDSFPRESSGLLLAYQESRSFVQYLVTTYGKERFLMFLNQLKGGTSLERASIESLSKSLGALEADWRESLESGTVWLVWVSRYMYEILFFVGALLTIAAFTRLAIRRRERLEEADRDQPEDEA